MRIKAKTIIITEELRETINEAMEKQTQANILKRKISELAYRHHGFVLTWLIKRKGNKMVVDKVYRKNTLTSSEQEELSKEVNRIGEDIIAERFAKENQ